MPDLTAKRTLVKSPPELWTELSEVEGLARHLGEFGEIQISRLEPEHTVAWEGEHARGLVELEPSGWGTKVTLTAEVAGAEVASAAEEPELPAPIPLSEPAALDLSADEEGGENEDYGEPYFTIPKRKRRRLGRWFLRPSSRAAAQPAEAMPGRLSDPEPTRATAADQEPASGYELAPQVAVAPAAPDFEPGAEAAVPSVPDQPADPQQPEATKAAVDERRAREVLENALESLGQAHHRPFSRG